MKSVLASYTLSLAVFIPISGWMADRFGTRRVFASAIGIFTLGSFLCGISSDIHWLVACRILQGCGGSMMVPVGRLTLVRTFAKSELVRAMSFVAIPSLIGPMLGPIAGGLIVGYLHWRLIFFVNIPIGLVGLFLVYWHLPDYRERTKSPGRDRPDSFWIRSSAAFVCVGGVWRTYTKDGRDSGTAGGFDTSPSGLWVSRDTQCISNAASHPVSHSHISRVRGR
jgi:MFS family permease